MVQGMVFAVGIDSGIIKMYDVRSYEKGPFVTFLVHSPPTASSAWQWLFWYTTTSDSSHGFLQWLQGLSLQFQLTAHLDLEAQSTAFKSNQNLLHHKGFSAMAWNLLQDIG